MPETAFDPTGAVRFDVKRGAASDAQGGRLVLVPAEALDSLERTSPGALAHLGRELGRRCGARAAASLGGEEGVRGSTLETVVAHLAGELAIAGLGAVHVERWGRALVLVIENAAVGREGLLGAALEGALAMASGSDVALAALGGDRASARFFVGSPETAAKVRALMAEGASWSLVLAALHTPTP